ncbi:hypothetical protein [Xanthomonas hyacinthi]|uniref:hypothetical protein n=1 Tax=Xanthomonas hyacinthi TaxID=56455 RepID=UPI00142EA5C1|nr:hypothetical protein [Xanthomonas hyacinthi]
MSADRLFLSLLLESQEARQAASCHGVRLEVVSHPCAAQKLHAVNQELCAAVVCFGDRLHLSASANECLKHGMFGADLRY